MNNDDDSQNLIIDKCVFYQEPKIDSLIFVVFPKALKFHFSHNEVIFENENSCLFGCDKSTLAGVWTFDSNSISPKEEKYIKTKNAIDSSFPATCENGFNCGTIKTPIKEPLTKTPTKEPSAKTPTEAPSTKIPTGETITFTPFPDLPVSTCDSEKQCNITGDEHVTGQLKLDYTEFKEINDNNEGGTISVINFALNCHKSNFEKCTSEKCGGAISIKNDLETNCPVSIEDASFGNCKDAYSGDIYAHSLSDSNKLLLTNSVFTKNQANKKGQTTNDKMFGGSAIFLIVSNMDINGCEFINNGQSMIKIFNNFNQLYSSSKLLSTFISISKCSFIAGKDSTASFFYIRGDKKEVPAIITDCIFVGDLQNGSHHIDCISLRKDEKQPMLFINSCKFSQNLESAINIKSLEKSQFASFESKSQVFNYHQKRLDFIVKLNMKIISVVGIIVFAIIIATVIAKNKINSDNMNSDNSCQNENI